MSSPFHLSEARVETLVDGVFAIATFVAGKRA